MAFQERAHLCEVMCVMGGWQTGYVRNNETASEIPEFREVKGSLLKWLEDPCKNGDLCKIILNENCV